MSGYVYQPWPSWMFVGTERRIVQNEEEAKALGAIPISQGMGLDRDGNSEPGGSKPAAEEDERSSLIVQLEAAGKPFDKRWGVKKLQAALDAG